MKTFWAGTALALVALLAIPSDAAAYIGPGAGLSAIGTVLGVLGAIVLAVIGFVWYPIKRLIMKLKGRGRASREVNPA